ncbi:MAG: NAD-binding protein [Candidatus Sumerlaeota bacterium]|nr:NAD-binding protein [Candidatus Sumerlaeota bacterium]
MMKSQEEPKPIKHPRSMTRRRLQIYLALLFLLVVIFIGITGFMFFERMSPLEAFFSTIIILTTIGLSGTEKIGHLSPGGMVFTIILALTGLATVTYAASFLVREIIAGELNTFLGRRIMERQLAALKDHFILCGFGRIGKIIAQEMRDSKTPLVVIENKPDRAGELECDGYLSVHGNAMDDTTLEMAGIRRARGLISTLDSDADNVFLILSARQMNPNIHLVVRSESDSAIEKLRRVGASAVISPLTMGGEIIAQAALRPNVVEFLTATTRGRYERYQIEEVPVSEQSALKDRSLKELGIAREHGIMIIGVRRKTGEESIFNPSADTVIRAGDILIILGERANVSRFMGHARG